MSNGNGDNEPTRPPGGPPPDEPGASIPTPPDPLSIAAAAAVGGLIGGLVGALIGSGLG
jgi:hypothetical protein